MSKDIPVFCLQCDRGHHRVCGMQTWCECQHSDDGTASHEEYEAYEKRMDSDDE